MASEEQIKQAASELDDHVSEMIQWHFSPDTGCPFWLNWAKEQQWSPLDEVHTFADLCQKFPHFQDEWLREGGILELPLRMEKGLLVSKSCVIDETKFKVKRLVEIENSIKKK